MNSWTLLSRIEIEKAIIAMMTEPMIMPTDPSRYSQKGRLYVTP